MFSCVWDFKIAQRNLNNNPPMGDFEDGCWRNPTVDPHMGKLLIILLVLLVVLPPILKIPILEGKAQFLTAAQLELIEDALQMCFHRFGCNHQDTCYFIVPMTEADQCNDLLFAMR